MGAIMVRAVSNGGAVLNFVAIAGVEPMNGTRRNDEGNDPAQEAALSARLRHLGERLDRIRRRPQDAPDPSRRTAADMSGFARGMRLSAELVGGVVLGFVLGWVFDHLLGTSPWGLIIFLLLGFVAGVLNVMRSAGVVKTRTLDD